MPQRQSVRMRKTGICQQKKVNGKSDGGDNIVGVAELGKGCEEEEVDVRRD